MVFNQQRSVGRQEPSDVLLDELARVRSTLHTYAQLNSRPSVSFAEDSADCPLPVQAFLSHLEFTEDGDLRVTSMSEADHSRLGRTAVFPLNLLLTSVPTHFEACGRRQRAAHLWTLASRRPPGGALQL